MNPSHDPAKTLARKTSKKPRHAASLIIYRESKQQLEVLLGKRHARARFAPDVYVFPGGAVDRADLAPDLDTPESLVPTAIHLAHLGIGANPALAQALLHAAVREAREETGLRYQPHTSDERIRYIGRAITPVFSPVRYHARFFAAPAESFEGNLAGDGELQNLHWVPVEAAYNYPLIDVTAFMLGELQQELAGTRTRLPLFTYYGKGPRVLYRAL